MSFAGEDAGFFLSSVAALLGNFESAECFNCVLSVALFLEVVFPVPSGSASRLVLLSC